MQVKGTSAYAGLLVLLPWRYVKSRSAGIGPGLIQRFTKAMGCGSTLSLSALLSSACFVLKLDFFFFFHGSEKAATFLFPIMGKE